LPAGSHVINYAKGVHVDGAKDEPGTILVWGEEPADDRRIKVTVCARTEAVHEATATPANSVRLRRVMNTSRVIVREEQACSCRPA
jgi:hypothetical protein